MARVQLESPVPSGSASPPGREDRSLALAASRGDDAAFATIYERHHAAIHRYCASMLGEHDAADALQATMTKALVALRKGDAPRDLRPWLYRIAHNESIDAIRERRSRAALGEAVEQSSGVAATVAPSPAERSEERERLQRLIADIRSLPARQRSAILMRELSGLSTAQIAAALETSEPAAKQAVYEARVALTEIQEGREMPCEPVQRAISDGDGRVLRGRQVRAHLRGCERCQAFAAAIEDRSETLHSYAPILPAALAGGILQQVLGAGASSGATAAAAGGGGAAAGVGAAGAGGAAALSGGVAKLAAIAAATIAIGAGGYEGLKVAGVVGGGEDRASEAGQTGGPGDAGSEAAASPEEDPAAGRDDRAASAADDPTSSATADGGSDVDTSQSLDPDEAAEGGRSADDGGSIDAEADDGGAGVSVPGERGAEQAAELPEAASDGQERAESRRPDHAGRPDQPGSQSEGRGRGSERSAAGRGRAEQGGGGSSNSNRGGNSGAAAERGGGSGGGGVGGSSTGAERGNGSGGSAEQRGGSEGGESSGARGRAPESESSAGDADRGRGRRQERGERPS